MRGTSRSSRACGRWLRYGVAGLVALMPCAVAQAASVLPDEAACVSECRLPDTQDIDPADRPIFAIGEPTTEGGALAPISPFQGSGTVLQAPQSDRDSEWRAQPRRGAR